jgi:hypothetical protein
MVSRNKKSPATTSYRAGVDLLDFKEFRYDSSHT